MFIFTLEASAQKDSSLECRIAYTDMNHFIGISNHFHIDSIIDEYKSKKFYYFKITKNTNDKNAPIEIKGFYSKKENFIESLNGESNFEFKYSTLHLKDSIHPLYFYPDMNFLVFDVSKSSPDWHAGVSIVIFKVNNKILIGFTTDNCSLTEFLNETLTNVFDSTLITEGELLKLIKSIDE